MVKDATEVHGFTPHSMQQVVREVNYLKRQVRNLNARRNADRQSLAPHPVMEVVRIQEGHQLFPGSNALIEVMRFDWNTQEWVPTKRKTGGQNLSYYRLYDAEFRNFGFSCELFHAYRNPFNDRLECVGEQGLIRTGVTDNPIAAGGAGVVSIHGHNLCQPTPGPIEDTMMNVWAHATWPDAAVDGNTKVTVRWDLRQRRWLIIAASGGGGGANLARFKLNEDMGYTLPGQAEAELLTLDGNPTGTIITVHDKHHVGGVPDLQFPGQDGLFGDAMLGCRGLAIFTGQYHIIQCEQRGILIKGQVQTTVNNTDTEFDLHDAVAISPTPYTWWDTTTNPIVVNNPHGFEVANLDTVVCAWNNKTDPRRYELIQGPCP